MYIRLGINIPLLLDIQLYSFPLSHQKNTKRQTIQHGCLHSLLGDGDIGTELVCGEEKNILYLYRLEQKRLNKILLYRHDKPNKPTQEGVLSFVHFESPFTIQQGLLLSGLSVPHSQPAATFCGRFRTVWGRTWSEAAYSCPISTSFPIPFWTPISSL